MRGLRLGIWILGIVLAVLAGAAVVVTQFVDPDKFRGRIEAAVRTATGRELQIRGGLQLSWFPWLAVTTRESLIAGAPGTAALATWREARIGARLLPLVRGQLEIDRIRVDGLVLRLVRTADGRANWAAPADASPGAPAATNGRPAALDELRIAGLDLRGATVEYIDESVGTYVGVCAVDVTASALAPGQVVDAAGALRLRRDANEACEAGLALRWSAKYRPDPAGPVLESLELLAGAARLAVPRAQWDAQQKMVTVSSWTLTVGNGRASGESLRLATPPTLDVDTRLTLDRLPLRQLAGALALPLPRTRDASVLGTASGTIALALRQGELQLRTDDLVIDDSRLQGQVRRAATERPWEFAWRVDTLRLERYLPPTDPDEPPFKFPGAELAQLQATGSLQVRKLQWLDMTAQDAELRLELRDGALRTVPTP